MKNKPFKAFSLLLLFGCAQVTSLNLQKHQFGKLPTKIVWLQIAGLAEEHLALLKYSYPTAEIKTSFEKSLCLGKTWEYNLYNLRPDADNGFLSQITGKKNITNSCEDYELKPIWSYVLGKAYKAGVFEGESSPENSLLQASACGKENFLKGLHFWKMDKQSPSDAKYFHVEETANFKPDEVYYDRSCLSGDCFSTFSNNVEKIHEVFSRNAQNYLFIIRNFQYARHLEKGEVSKAKEELSQLNKVVAAFQGLAESRSDFLLLVTSAAAKSAQFPEMGKQWREYEKNGKNFVAKRSNLMSTVMVNGARAENFCGLYDQSEIMSRIFSGAKQQGLELTILNPFEQ